MESIQDNQNVISQWHGFSHSKCPRCRVGKVFQGSTYSLKVQKMNEFCPHCELKFEREPGYFYGAMFISYALNVAEIITACVIATFLGLELREDNLWFFVGVLFMTTLVFSPFNYRYSRMILLYFLSPGLVYDSKRSAQKSQKVQG